MVRWNLLGVVLLGLMLPATARTADAQDNVPAEAWKLEDVPQIWTSFPNDHYSSLGGYAWFRCLVQVPESWEGRKLELFVEAVDDAREVYFNGDEIGILGSFPPAYRSGLGTSLRFPIEGRKVLFGQTNVVAVRIYQYQGRSGFNVAAPVLFGGDQAIRLKGPWEGSPGDDQAWARLSVRTQIDEQATFAETEDGAEINRTLKQLDDDEGPLAVADAIEKMTIADDLRLELAVGEPHVRQPLSFKWDQRARLWVVQYLQYPKPAGLKMVSRDKYLRAVFDKVPLPPPHHFKGRDAITIHEDTDHDGVYDLHKTFVDGLSLATSFAFGRGGLWVLNPPYLLFYPDRDGDDVPDRDPDVILEGFGLEDSHSIANNLRWGPDGWLRSAATFAVMDPRISPFIRWVSSYGVTTPKRDATRRSPRAAETRLVLNSTPRAGFFPATTAATRGGFTTSREVIRTRGSASMASYPILTRSVTSAP